VHVEKRFAKGKRNIRQAEGTPNYFLNENTKWEFYEKAQTTAKLDFQYSSRAAIATKEYQDDTQ
jgi:hypothetical protein